MLSFRSELEKIKKAKNDPKEFEAEILLEKVINSLKELDVSKLAQINSLHFKYENFNVQDVISVYINGEDKFFSKTFKYLSAKEVFNRVKLIVSRGYWITETECEFYFNF